MKKNELINFKTAFDNYKKIFITVENDLKFWKSFLNWAIKNYQKQDIQPDNIFTTVFTVYDRDCNSCKGLLKTSNDFISLKTKNLEEHKNLFFTWIMNLSILKVYNAMELFLFQIIWLQYFPTLDNPLKNKKSADGLQKNIKSYLITKHLKADTKNNRHIIEFLKSQSKDYENFTKVTIRKNLTTTWVNFFEFLSILRNIIAHQGTLIGQDTLNEIKSIAKDIFEEQFTLSKDSSGLMNLAPNESVFERLLSFISDFSANTAKFIANEQNLKFLNLYDIQRMPSS